MQRITRRKLLGTSGVAAGSVTLGLPLLAALATAEEPRVDRKLKVVVAGGHPDDPETGCGGTMALYSKAGHDVVALYLIQ